MKYLYECAGCKVTQTLNRKVNDRNLPAPCACGSDATRIFSASFQVCSERQADRPENKYALGFDEKTRTATRKADDADYEKSWAGRNPVKLAPPKETLVETHQKMWGNI
jgi:hypothetical protein